MSKIWVWTCARRRCALRSVLHYTRASVSQSSQASCSSGRLAISFISPLIMSVTIDSVLGTKPLNVGWYFKWYIYAIGGADYIRLHLWLMAAAMVGMQALAGLIRFIRTKLNTHAGEGSVRELRNRLYAHILPCPSFGTPLPRPATLSKGQRTMLTPSGASIRILIEFARTVLILCRLFIVFKINAVLARHYGRHGAAGGADIHTLFQPHNKVRQRNGQPGRAVHGHAGNLTGIRWCAPLGVSAYK